MKITSWLYSRFLIGIFLLISSTEGSMQQIWKNCNDLQFPFMSVNNEVQKFIREINFGNFTTLTATKRPLNIKISLVCTDKEQSLFFRAIQMFDQECQRKLLNPFRYSIPDASNSVLRSSFNDIKELIDCVREITQDPHTNTKIQLSDGDCSITERTILNSVLKSYTGKCKDAFESGLRTSDQPETDCPAIDKNTLNINFQINAQALILSLEMGNFESSQITHAREYINLEFSCEQEEINLFFRMAGLFDKNCQDILLAVVGGSIPDGSFSEAKEKYKNLKKDIECLDMNTQNESVISSALLTDGICSIPDSILINIFFGYIDNACQFEFENVLRKFNNDDFICQNGDDFTFLNRAKLSILVLIQNIKLTEISPQFHMEPTSPINLNFSHYCTDDEMYLFVQMAHLFNTDCRESLLSSVGASTPYWVDNSNSEEVLTYLQNFTSCLSEQNVRKLMSNYTVIFNGSCTDIELIVLNSVVEYFSANCQSAFVSALRCDNVNATLIAIDESIRKSYSDMPYFRFPDCRERLLETFQESGETMFFDCENDLVFFAYLNDVIKYLREVSPDSQHPYSIYECMVNMRPYIETIPERSKECTYNEVSDVYNEIEDIITNILMNLKSLSVNVSTQIQADVDLEENCNVRYLYLAGSFMSLECKNAYNDLFRLRHRGQMVYPNIMEDMKAKASYALLYMINNMRPSCIKLLEDVYFKQGFWNQECFVFDQIIMIIALKIDSRICENAAMNVLRKKSICADYLKAASFKALRNNQQITQNINQYTCFDQMFQELLLPNKIVEDPIQCNFDDYKETKLDFRNHYLSVVPHNEKHVCKREFIYNIEGYYENIQKPPKFVENEFYIHFDRRNKTDPCERNDAVEILCALFPNCRNEITETLGWDELSCTDTFIRGSIYNKWQDITFKDVNAAFNMSDIDQCFAVDVKMQFMLRHTVFLNCIDNAIRYTYHSFRTLFHD